MITYFYVRGKEKKMKSTKKKIVALSTAFVMAFALVAAMLPTVSQAVNNEKYIYPDGFIGTGAEGESEAHGAYMANIPGTSEYTSIEKGEGNTLTFTGLTINGGDFTGISFYSGDAWTFKFVGTNSMNMIVNDGGGALTVSVADNSTVALSKVIGGFSLADGTKADKDISNASFDEPVENVTLSGPTGGDDPSPTPDPDPTPSSDVPTIDNGSTVEVAPAEDGTVTFRFEKDLEYFENGGKLYIDGQEVPTDMYSATRGSTIITLFKEYAAKLADGAEHAVKVVFNDNTSVEGKIVVKAASSDSSASTAANGTSGTASSTAATTTKVTSPKTADVLPIAGIALVFVGATAIGVIAFRRKNS